MVALSIALLLTAIGTPSDPQADGLAALDRHDYPQAEEIFTKLAAADPKDYFALFNLALAETELKKDDAAATHFQQTLAIKPGLYEAELNLGLLYLRGQHLPEAATHLSEAARLKPDVLAPKTALAEALFRQSRWPEAEQAYRDVVSLDPKSALAELHLGQCLLKQNKWDEALPYYRQAATLDPRLKPRLLELAAALSEAKRSQDAIPLLREFPDDPAARSELGRVYLASNQPALAVPEFEAAAKLAPTPANQIALASSYLQNNQADDAAPLIERALAANPNDFELQMEMGKIVRDQRHFEAAANYFLAAGKLKPDDPKPWKELGSVCVLAELYPQALAAFDKVHQLNAESAGDYYFRAISLDHLHQTKPAVENYKRFLELCEGKFPNEEFKARQRIKLLTEGPQRR